MERRRQIGYMLANVAWQGPNSKFIELQSYARACYKKATVRDKCSYIIEIYSPQQSRLRLSLSFHLVAPFGSPPPASTPC